jgi:hypothetical protein
MFKKILIADRGDNGRKAVAAKPNCMARAARTGDLSAIVVQHV